MLHLIQQFGNNVLEEVFRADNDALVLLYNGDSETARSENTDPIYDWIVVQDDDKLCLLDVNDKNFLTEHRIIILRQLADSDPLVGNRNCIIECLLRLL